MLTMPAARGFKSKVAGAAALGVWSGAAFTVMVKSLRARIHNICYTRCNIKSLKHRLSYEVDPNVKRKIAIQIAKHKIQMNQDVNYVQQKLAKLKAKHKNVKLQKFQIMLKQVQRI